MQDSNNETLKIISNERSRFSEETSLLLKNERGRLNKIHEQELYNKEKQFELSLKQQQLRNEQELESYKKQMEQQIELARLSDQFQISIGQLGDIAKKVDREKTLEEKTKNESLLARERILKEMERKINEQKDEI